MPTNRVPKSYYFSRLYSQPFHRNVDRIAEVDFRTFDPFVPENRQTVANCKKHRRQRHELSDKCKHVLAIVDAQENLLTVKPQGTNVQQQSEGGNSQKTDISIEFGDGIPETAKEYIKYWLTNSGLVKKPYSRTYDVHGIKDEHNHSDMPSVVMMVPFEELPKIDQTGMKKIFDEFNSDPVKYSRQNKVGNVRIYSTNKISGDSDALGLKEFLPLKIVGSEVIGKDLKKAYITDEFGNKKKVGYSEELAQLEMKYKSLNSLKQKLLELPEDDIKYEEKRMALETKIVDESLKMKKLINNVKENISRDEKDELLGMLDSDEELLQDQLDIKDKKRQNKENRQKELEILTNLLSPENNIAPNRGKSGTDPIGRAIQIAETATKIPLNIVNAVGETIKLKEQKKEDELKEQMKQLQRDRKHIQRSPAETSNIVFEVRRDKQKPFDPEEQKRKEEEKKTKQEPSKEEEFKEYENIHETMAQDKQQEEQEQPIAEPERDSIINNSNAYSVNSKKKRRKAPEEENDLRL